MRTIQLSVHDDHREGVVEILDGEDIDFVTTRGSGPTGDSWIFEFPLPTDAVGDVIDDLREAGVDEDDYVVIGTAEAAMTPHSEELMERYASNFDPLARPELRSKARDLTYDPRSYYAMLVLSSVIATVGVLTDSPAVIVGSMVIAPLVGPVLTTGVGTVTDDRKMVVDSIRLQAGGLAVTMVTAALAGYVLQFTFLAPPGLDVTAVESISVRSAPGLMLLTVSLAAGGAAAYSLATKGPTALIGVMIAAALLPTAAVVGVGLVWGYPLVSIGALLLLVATMLAVNAGVLVVLWTFGYRPSPGLEGSIRGAVPAKAIVLALVVMFGAVGGVVGTAAYSHGMFEREANQAVNDALQEPESASLQPVETSVQYGGPEPLGSPRSVTVVFSAPSGESYPGLATDIDERITERTGKNVSVRVRFMTYQLSDRDAGNASDRIRVDPIG